jgi:predicted RNA binding protein YcfA (HicA-like mRNA interferase family)
VFCIPKLRPLSQRKVIDILQSNGFEKVRSSKNTTFKKRVDNRVLTTWVPHHKEVTVFVLQYIIKQTEKPRSISKLDIKQVIKAKKVTKVTEVTNVQLYAKSPLSPEFKSPSRP